MYEHKHTQTHTKIHKKSIKNIWGTLENLKFTKNYFDKTLYKTNVPIIFTLQK